jgi:hypothetical protein
MAVGGEARTRRSRGRCSLLCIRVREATRHGDADDRERELEVRRKRRGQKPSLASRATACACWGARLREGVAARTDARANANAPATGHGGGQDGVAPYTARGARLGKPRARVGEAGGTCKKTRPSLARWPASPVEARRRGATVVLPQLDGRGIHKRGKTGVLTFVATGRSEARR